jgi:hypothetical protein
MTTKDLHLAFKKDTGKHPPSLTDEDIIGRASSNEYISWLEQKLCESSPVIIHGRNDILVTSKNDSE